MKAEIDASERRMRERLRSLPDGVYRARDYIDHDGLDQRALRGLPRRRIRRGDELVFDLRAPRPRRRASSTAPGPA